MHGPFSRATAGRHCPDTVGDHVLPAAPAVA